MIRKRALSAVPGTESDIFLSTDDYNNNTLIVRRVKTEKSLFVLSLDTELGWGYFDSSSFESMRDLLMETRSCVRKLLALLDTYSIAVTWAVVGHLFLTRCSPAGEDSHNHVLQPQYRWYPRGWLSHDPYSDMEKDPLYYAPDIIQDIISARQPHEIGCHTFTHAILGDPQCTREVARSQLEECKHLAAEMNIELVSLVFPRNSIGHLDVLCELGFKSFRGVEKRWYRALDQSSILGRGFHFLDRLLAPTPPCYSELIVYSGRDGVRHLVDIPSSMFFPPFGGLWNAVSLSRRVLQAKRGIAQAVKRKGIFHLWFHPENLVSSPLLLEGLEEILCTVDGLRSDGVLESCTMAEVASLVASRLEQSG